MSVAMRYPTSQRVSGVLRGCALAILLLYTLVPVVWMLGTSLKSRALILSSTPVIFFDPDFSAYRQFLSPGRDSIVPNLVNSLSVALATTALTLVLGSLAGYGFSRYRFPGQRALLLLMLATRLLPPITAVVPLFLSVPGSPSSLT